MDSKQVAQSESKWARIKISHDDFLESLEYLDSYKDAPSDTLKRAVLCAAVVAYARPFSANHGLNSFGGGKLLLTDLEIPGEAPERLHAELMELRNKAVAHADYEYRPTRRVPTPGLLGMVCSKKEFNILHAGLDLGSFRELVVHAKDSSFRTLLSMGRFLDEAPE